MTPLPSSPLLCRLLILPQPVCAGLSAVGIQADALSTSRPLLLYLCLKQHSPFETCSIRLLEVPDPVFLPVLGDCNVLVDKPSAFSLFIPWMASTSPTSRPFYFSHLHTRPFARPASPKIASNTPLSDHCHTSFQLSYVSDGPKLDPSPHRILWYLVSPLSYRLSAPHGLISSWPGLTPNQWPQTLFINLSIAPPCLAELLTGYFSIFPLLLDHCR